VVGKHGHCEQSLKVQPLQSGVASPISEFEL